MCGRFCVSDKVAETVSKLFNIYFSVKPNSDLRPTEVVSTIIASNGNFQQLDVSWGIQPQWSKKLLINAQSETVAIKPTFKNAFQYHRCLVPCSGKTYFLIKTLTLYLWEVYTFQASNLNLLH